MRTRRIPLLLISFFLTSALLGAGAPLAAAVKLPFLGNKNDTPYVSSGKWEAYLRDDKGRLLAFQEPVERYGDRDWMFLKFSEFDGPRLRLAVMRVENKTAFAEQAQLDSGWTHTQLQVNVAAVEEMLSAALFNTNRFQLVARKKVATVLAEQDFGTSGRLNTKTAAKIGNVLGADYLLMTAINEWAPEKKKIGGGGGYGGVLGNLGVGKTTAEVAMSFELVDATTGEMVASKLVRATAGSWGISGLGGSGGATGSGSFSSGSPINYALQSCLNKAVYQIATSLKTKPWRAMVAKVEGDKVTLNAGSNRGIKMGMELTALAKGEPILDPETEMSLGEDTEAIGSLTVTTVKDNLSIATVVQGCKGLKKGDYVEIAAENPGK